MKYFDSTLGPMIPSEKFHLFMNNLATTHQSPINLSTQSYDLENYTLVRKIASPSITNSPTTTARPFADITNPDTRSRPRLKQIRLFSRSFRQGVIPSLAWEREVCERERVSIVGPWPTARVVAGSLRPRCRVLSANGLDTWYYFMCGVTWDAFFFRWRWYFMSLD